jgi:hypothetical protein
MSRKNNWIKASMVLGTKIQVSQTHPLYRCCEAGAAINLINSPTRTETGAACKCTNENQTVDAKRTSARATATISTLFLYYKILNINYLDIVWLSWVAKSLGNGERGGIYTVTKICKIDTGMKRVFFISLKTVNVILNTVYISQYCLQCNRSVVHFS